MDNRKGPMHAPFLRNIWAGAAVFSLLALRIASPPSANLSFLVLAVYSMLGRAQAIQALALSWLFSMVNPGIAAEATQGAVGRYAVIFAAALSILLRSGLFLGRSRVRVPVMATILLGLFFVGHSQFFSSMADVSILKAVSWMAVMATLLSAWNGLTVDERDRLARQIFAGLTILLVFSLPLLVHPLGYLRNYSGFQGVLNHPQAFGLTMALLGAWVASQMFANVRPSWLSVGLVAACLALVLLSEARTAGVALVLGVGLAIVSAPALSGQRILRVLPGLRSTRVWAVLAVGLMLGVLMAPRIADVAKNYITKSGRAAEVSGLMEAYERSRGGLMDKMWVNIGERPLTGIGFGIASIPGEMLVERDPVLNLPVGAAIEKGVMPLAVLEELGIFGFALVALWMWMLIRRATRGGVAPLAVTGTALLLNMGEATFFSPGGMGMLSLVLVSWAFTAGQKQERA